MIPITRATQRWDIELQEVIDACNIKPEGFKDQESRLSAEKTTLIVEYCNKISNRKDFAIEVARQFYLRMPYVREEIIKVLLPKAFNKIHSIKAP